MDQLGDPLTTCPVQTGWEFIIDPYRSWRYRFIDNQDSQFGNGSGWTRTRTRSDGPEPLLTLCSSNTAAETIERIVALCNQLLRDLINAVLSIDTLIVVRLCHGWVRTSWVDPSANHAVDIVDPSGLNFWWGRMKIRIRMTKFLSAGAIKRMIDVSCIARKFCSTSQTQLRQDPKLTCFPSWQTVVDGCRSECNDRWIDFINRWSIFHSHLSYTIEEYPVNTIHNFCHCKLKLALLNWLSR